jgi:hypothetical protein
MRAIDVTGISQHQAQKSRERAQVEMLLLELHLSEAQVVAVQGFLDSYLPFGSGWHGNTPLDARWKRRRLMP